MVDNQEPTIFIRSKNFFYRIVINVLGVVFITGFISVIFYTEYIDHIPVSDDFFEKWLGMAIIAGFFLFLVIGFFFKWLQISFRKTKSIIFHSDSITIGEETISHSKIVSVKIMDVDKIAYEPFYGASIYLANGEVKFIAEQFYNQSSLLFQRLERLRKDHFPKEVEIDIPLNQKVEEVERFNFKYYSSIEHILSLALLSMILFGIIKFILYPVHPVSFTYAMVLLGILIYYLIGRTSYYFIIDNHNLEIRNKLFFGFSRVYRLNEIKGILLHTRGMGRSMQFGLRIVMNDYRTHFFAANTYRKSKWQALANALRKRGTYVENKIYGSEN